MGRSGRGVQGHSTTIGKTPTSRQNYGKTSRVSLAIKRSAQVIALLFICLSTLTCMHSVKDKKTSESNYSQNIGKVVIHKQTSNFIDIEAPVGELAFGCVDIDKKDNLAFMAFYVADVEKTWDFFYRKVLSISMCKEEEKEYKEIIKNAKTIRIVGISPSDEVGPDAKYDIIPERFTNVKKLTASIFIRLQAGEKCKSHFDHHCELPENYWADTIPQY